MDDTTSSTALFVAHGRCPVNCARVLHTVLSGNRRDLYSIGTDSMQGCNILIYHIRSIQLIVFLDAPGVYYVRGN